jgi:AcrR family transcriptional regulator
MTTVPNAQGRDSTEDTGGDSSGRPRELVGLRGHRVLDPDRTESRRREVLHAAARVFAAKGFHACTIEDIAVAMGLSKGVVYYYFRSKEEIYVEVVSTAILGAQERLERLIATGKPPVEMLKEAIEAHLADNLNPEHEGYYAMLVINDLRRTSEEARSQVRDLQRRYVRRFASIVQRGIDEGAFVSGDAAVATLTILTAVNYASDWYRPAGRRSPEEVIRQISEQLVSGVLAGGQERQTG